MKGPRFNSQVLRGVIRGDFTAAHIDFALVFDSIWRLRDMSANKHSLIRIGVLVLLTVRLFIVD